MADRPLIALEISPLSERLHSGIANVTKGLATELLADGEVEGRFFFNRHEMPRDLVEKVLQLDGADLLWWVAARASFPQQIHDTFDRSIIGIYSATKWHRRLFPIEVQVIHDLTTVITPQFHDAGTVAFWNEKLEGDMASSDLIVAVSEATRQDIATYFPELSHIPCIAAPIAVDTEIAPLPPGTHVPPYVVVLGTLEPRKNVEMVFELLSTWPEILDSASFLFIGRFGWGNSTRVLVKQYGLEQHVTAGRIRFTGFVANAVRDQLVAHARCVIYPSLYEGFGLPILEALTLGTPVLAGTNSSLPEAGGPAATYFDLTSIASLATALTPYLQPGSHATTSARGDRESWASGFSWPKTYRRIRDAALAIADARKP